MFGILAGTLLAGRPGIHCPAATTLVAEHGRTGPTAVREDRGQLLTLKIYECQLDGEQRSAARLGESLR
jgi:hypothetical protein